MIVQLQKATQYYYYRTVLAIFRRAAEQKTQQMQLNTKLVGWLVRV